MPCHIFARRAAQARGGGGGGAAADLGGSADLGDETRKMQVSPANEPTNQRTSLAYQPTRRRQRAATQLSHRPRRHRRHREALSDDDDTFVDGLAAPPRNRPDYLGAISVLGDVTTGGGNAASNHALLSIPRRAGVVYLVYFSSTVRIDRAGQTANTQLNLFRDHGNADLPPATTSRRFG